MDYRFDTVIIGAGPAGMGCGIVLQKKHHNVCVIDKAVFPRNKTCAGLVTSKTYRLIQTLFDGENTDDLFCFTAKSIKLYRKTELLTQSTIKNGARLVNRIDFDNALVDRYKSLGGRIMEGSRIVNVDYANNCVLLASGDTVSYRFLVFADGALSLSHQSVKVDKREMAFGIEAYVPSSQFHTQSVDLYFDCINDGYLWVFPHGDTVCVGAANLYDKTVDYKKLLVDFLKEYGIDPEQQHYTGAFLPYGYAVPQNKTAKDVILVGDAGGFTDPISGEGLYMALKTGMLAADSLSAGDPKKDFLKHTKPILSIIKEGKKVQKLFFSSSVQKAFLNKVKGRNELVSFFYDNMVDEYRYGYNDMMKMYADYKKQIQ